VTRRLKSAGFEVLAATDSKTVRRTCAEHDLRLVMLGHSLSPAEKRRVWVEVHKYRNIPVLELHKESEAELMAPAFFHESFAPDAFLIAVMRICKPKS
jgi:DNA-binding response OmpR family regulator